MRPKVGSTTLHTKRRNKTQSVSVFLRQRKLPLSFPQRPSFSGSNSTSSNNIHKHENNSNNNNSRLRPKTNRLGGWGGGIIPLCAEPEPLKLRPAVVFVRSHGQRLWLDLHPNLRNAPALSNGSETTATTTGHPFYFQIHNVRYLHGELSIVRGKKLLMNMSLGIPWPTASNT